MSNTYKHSKDVPNYLLCKRLKELARAVSQGGQDIEREFPMHVPVELDHDATLVLNEAADRLEKYHARLKIIFDTNGSTPEWIRDLIRQVLNT